MKHLTDKDIEDICWILDWWEGKLTWEALIQSIKVKLKRTFTRQALDRHLRIKQAFALRKKQLREEKGKTHVKSAELQEALDRGQRLQNENQRLKAENQQLLEQFARWAYNAYSKGLTQEQLDQPLPPVDRARTKLRAAGSA